MAAEDPRVIKERRDGYTQVIVTETTRHSLFVRDDLFEDGEVDEDILADPLADNLGFEEVEDRDIFPVFEEDLLD